MRKKDLAITIGAVVVVVAICYGIAMAMPQTAPVEKRTSATPKGSERVVMHVNGEAVTEREFNLYVMQLPEQMQGVMAVPEARRDVADQIVKLKVLEQEGRRLGGDRDPEVSSRIDFGRSNVLAGYALQKIAGEANEATLRAEYDKQKREFETVELSHILTAYRGGAIPPRRGEAPPVEEAMRRAEALAARIRAGADFAAVAREHSDDTGSAPNGGLLGPMPPGALPEEISRAIAALPPGQVSGPVRTQHGVHLFRAGERKTAPFEQVRPMLIQRMQQQAVEREIARLQKSAKVDLDPRFFPQRKKPS